MFYNPTGREGDIQPMGKMFGSTVYNYESKPEFSFYNKHGDDILNTEAGKKPAQKEPIPRNIAPDSLVFESRFECGNLMRAVRITDTYYELHLRQDFYTTRHCQWFYFQVKKSISKNSSPITSFVSDQVQNMKTDVKYRLSIVNFTKPDSLYTCGMKPVLYSKVEADRHFVGWTRVGDNIR